jgi:hypothetical protein
VFDNKSSVLDSNFFVRLCLQQVQNMQERKFSDGLGISWMDQIVLVKCAFCEGDLRQHEQTED